MTPWALLLDLDGTLVDSLDDLTDAVNHMREHFSLSSLPRSDVRLMVGKGARHLITQALPDAAGNELTRGLELFLAFNRAHIADKSRLYPGVPDALRAFADAGIAMAVISNKTEELSRNILETLGVSGYFAAIYGGDTFPEMKPSAVPLVSAMSLLGLDPARTAMVGDSGNDIQAGITAGIATIACTWGYGLPEELEGATYRAASLDKLMTIVGGLV